MIRKQRFEAVIAYFQTERPEVETELNFESTFQLLVAVILSAQCTDKRVNQYTPALFRRYPDALSLAQADYDELFSYIKSISFPGNKSRHLIGMGKIVTEKFNGEVPMTVEELVQLPGVG